METNYFALLGRQKGENSRQKQNKRNQYFFLKCVYSVSMLFAAKESGKGKKLTEQCLH